MSIIIPDFPSEVIPSDAVQLHNYQRALVLAARLLAEAPIVPNHVVTECRSFAPETVTIKAYAHMDRAGVEAWHAHFGGELATEKNGDRVQWSAAHTLDGIRVECWTLTDPEPRDVWADAEALVLTRWIDQHGDPADWCEQTRAAYANTIANMRAGGQL